MMPPWRKVVCIASGPSLTAADCEVVRAWRGAGHGRVIVINTSFRLAPWADVLYACDAQWWKKYWEEMDATFRGERCSVSVRAAKELKTVHIPNRETPKSDKEIERGLNSGHQALELARLRGGQEMILLGYDFQRTGGKNHWHPDHPAMNNLGRVHRWVEQMERLSERYCRMGLRVVNATRETALQCFPRASIEEALR
jgi:hypothetical protein